MSIETGDIEKARRDSNPQDTDTTSAPISMSSHTQLEASEKRVEPPPKPQGSQFEIPDGGISAWLQVVGSFFLYFNSWGLINAYGAYQTYYETSILSDQSPSNIAWIGSLQGFLLVMIGAVTGPAYDAGYFKTLVMGGSFLVVFGMMMTSISETYWEIMLAQAVTTGLGMGCLFLPAIAILPQYFSSHKALATGVSAAGSSLARIDFGWTTSVIAFIALFTCTISISAMRVRAFPAQKRALLQLSAFKEPTYLSLIIALFVGFTGIYLPQFFLQSYASAQPGVPSKISFYLLPILNATSIPCRVFSNFIADKTGPLNMFIPLAFISGILALSRLAIHSVAGLIAFAILYGFFSGGFVSIPPVAVVSISTDMRTIGTRMGMVFGACSFALLIGPQVAGAILNSSGRFEGLQIFGGVVVLMCGPFLLLTRTLKVGLRFGVKA